MDRAEIKKETQGASLTTSSNICDVDNTLDTQGENPSQLNDVIITPQSIPSHEPNLVKLETSKVALKLDRTSTTVKQKAAITDNSPLKPSERRYRATRMEGESNLLELENMPLDTTNNEESSNDQSTPEGKCVN